VKRCTKCGAEKDFRDFRKALNCRQGVRPECRVCNQLQAKTPLNHTNQMYSNQKSTSKRRGHMPPSYTKNTFRRWCMKQPVYHELHADWVASDYSRLLAPSCDRINDYKPYTLDNLQLMTWNENKLKGESDRKNGILITSQMRAVNQYKLDGTFVREYHSVNEAGRRASGDIIACCKGRVKSAGGFKWKYKEVV